MWGIIFTIYTYWFGLQEEREMEEKRLQQIMEENNKKILEAQRKLVCTNAVVLLINLDRVNFSVVF